MYIENPKTKGSGIYCVIPQAYEPCPRQCKDCYFLNGRSYLEPLEKNLPNMPPDGICQDFVIRVNDGLDSGHKAGDVIQKTAHFPNKFYNTSYPHKVALLSEYAPVVLTINPDPHTDTLFFDQVYDCKPMFVRFRANMWNVKLLDKAIAYWCYKQKVPLVITFMRYYNENEQLAKHYNSFYTKKEHILNQSWSINQWGWDLILYCFRNNPLVFTCGRDANNHLCKDCGVCLQLYWRSKNEYYLKG